MAGSMGLIFIIRLIDSNIDVYMDGGQLMDINFDVYIC